MSGDRPMYDIDMHEPSHEFARCWKAAGQHIQKMVQGPMKSWLRAHLNPPFLEHLSFRLGNQLFFVRIEDVDGVLEVPGSRPGLMTVAAECSGHPCLMPMRHLRGAWQPVRPGWGLLDVRFGHAIDPPTLVNDEKIEMTDWELHDFAVQVVRDYITQLGRELMSWQGNPSADPSIWFVGENGPEWVVVRAVRFPMRDAKPPANLDKIKAQCSRLSPVGHFASVGIASSDEAHDDSGIVPPTPLWRGHGMVVRFEGLSPIAV